VVTLSKASAELFQRILIFEFRVSPSQMYAPENHEGDIDMRMRGLISPPTEPKAPQRVPY
jgi:hypothetical protein